jgi:FkbM family methyltransferase
LPEQVVPYPPKYPYLETPQTFGRYLDGYRWAYDFFEDTPSCRLILDRMRLYLLDAPLHPNSTSTIYYEEGIVELAENEVFVDGGAYDGNTIETFIDKMRATEKAYSRAYAFEPGAANCAKAVQRLADHKDVEIVQKGLWSAEKSLLFFENASAAGSSFVIGNGDGQAVQVTSLDKFFHGRSYGELPTFIKMDIEGAEKEALLGAADIIRRKKPKLSICAYHKPEDVFELPRTIRAIRDDYRFALRQHFAGAWDTVLYAV